MFEYPRSLKILLKLVISGFGRRPSNEYFTNWFKTIHFVTTRDTYLTNKTVVTRTVHTTYTRCICTYWWSVYFLNPLTVSYYIPISTKHFCSYFLLESWITFKNLYLICKFYLYFEILEYYHINLLKYFFLSM